MDCLKSLKAFEHRFQARSEYQLSTFPRDGSIKKLPNLETFTVDFSEYIAFTLLIYLTRYSEAGQLDILAKQFARSRKLQRINLCISTYNVFNSLNIARFHSPQELASLFRGLSLKALGLEYT